MRLCVVSFKECWQDDDGVWMSYGGFPLQMAAITSLFDASTLVVVRGQRRAGGIRLPLDAQVHPLRRPVGRDFRRKISVVANAPYYLSKIIQAVRDADVVHTPLPGDIALLGMVGALGMRRRLLARYGGSWVPNSETTVMNRVTRQLMRMCAGGRNIMLVTGVGNDPPAARMSWIFSTALSKGELETINPQTDRPLAVPPRLVYAGRLSPEKGVANLIKAVGVLAARGITPLPHVTLAGNGPERGPLEALVRETSQQVPISFAGQLDRDALSRLMAQADICVQPSLSEGFSKAWLDAFAHGLPVVASDVGAAADVIGRDGERGWLVRPGDVTELAARLEQALTAEGDWPALRRRCREFVESRTLEGWATEIGRRCAQQWGLTLVDGRLVA